MRPLAVLTILVVASLLAGCADAPTEPVVDTQPDPCLVQSPDDTRCLEENPNGTMDNRSHLHDYWGGQDRLTVLEQAREVGSTFASGSVSYSFVPETDHVVPQGTAMVEVTLTWAGDDLSNPGPATLWVKTAADSEHQEIGPVESGDTVAVASDNEKNDLPHQRLSGWSFRLRLEAAEDGPAPDDPAVIHFRGEVAAHVVAVRGLEIPLYPGHPDRWDGQDRILLFEAPMETRVNSGGGDLGPAAVGSACFTGCFRVLTPDDAIVVPYDAAAVEVTLTHEQDTPFTAGLSYHGAASRDFERIAPSDEEGRVRTYIIPVEGDGDGPYALQSQWAFQAFIEGPEPDGVFADGIALRAEAVRGPV